MNRTAPLLIAGLIMLTLLSAAAPAAHAELVINKYTNDFSASSPNNEQLKLCACGAKVDSVVVQNTGNFVADFRVEAQSQYPDIRIPEADFQLAPGHFKEVLIYIEDTCSAAGVYGYDVVVTNSYGRMQRISRSIRIDMCQTTALAVTPDNATVGLCKPATFRVNITNVGTYADSFRLDFGPYNSIAQLRQQGVYLTAGQSYAQNVSFTFPCTEYGERVIPFTVTTDKAGPGAQTSRMVTIINQYNFALDVPTDISVCAQATTRVPIAVRNLADAPDDLVLQSSSPLFSVPSDIHLDPLQEKNFSVTLAPAEPGSQTVTVTATDIYGGVQKQRDIRIDAQDCYAFSVEVRDTPTHTLTAPAQACCGTKTFYVNVRNDGDRRQTFNIRIDGPTIFTLDETTVQLEPTENINVPARARLPCTDERYTADVVVAPAGQPQLEEKAQLVVDSQTQRTCHMVQIDEDEYTIGPETQSIAVPVVHTGSAAGNYTITYNSTIFSVEEQSISLLPGETKDIHLVSTVDLGDQEPGRYIVQPTFTLEDQGIAYNEFVGVTLAGKGAFAAFMEWLGSLLDLTLCQWVVLLLFLTILVIAAGLIAIYAGWAPFGEGVERQTLTIIKSALLILILLLLLSMLLLQPPSIEERYERVAQGNGTVIEWYQDMQRFVDLQQYFYDPDMDIISYSVTQPADISAQVEGTTLVLTPDQGWAGENQLVITATDTKGESTESPPITLRVIAERQYTFGGKVGLWCPYIIVLELIILLLLLFLIVLTIKEYRPSPYKSNVLVVIDRKETRRPARKAAKRPSKSPAKKSGGSRTEGTAGTRAGAAAGRAGTGSNGASRAIIPVKGRIVSYAPARGQQVDVPQAPLVREYRSSGQTVNIAVGAVPQQAPTVLAVPGAKPSEIVYVGSKSGTTVHAPSCIVARRIPRNKRVAYSSKREAVNAGLVPCKVCRPFEGGM